MALIVIGNFDGVHLGHRDILNKSVALAKSRHERVTAFTFATHPRAYFGEKTGLILSNAEKETLILGCGADEVVLYPFDGKTASMSPESFVKMLVEEYDCTALCCGTNFRFGRGGEGEPRNIHTLNCKAPDVYIYGLLCDEYGIISSTAIRKAVGDGDMEAARRMLGRPFSIAGSVVHGKHLASTLGFPTVNIIPDEERLLPKFGVYETVTDIGGETFFGVTNVGIRPTVDDGETVTVETNLISDSPQNLYGKYLKTSFLHRLRDEKRFANIEALREQIALDRQAVIDDM